MSIEHSHGVSITLSKDQLVSKPLFVNYCYSIILISLVITLFSNTFVWIGKQLLSAHNVFHIIISLILCFVVVKSVIDNKIKLNSLFCFRKYPLFVLSVGCLGYLLNEHFISVNIFSAVWVMIAAYGLLGFYIKPAIWTKVLLPLVLLILLLPFEGYLDVYLGFPLRLLSVEWVESLLSGLGIDVAADKAVIMVENKYSLVDLSCSGLKGLWAGIIFYVLLTWIDNKAITWRWFILLVIFLFIILLFNTLRILCLVVLDSVLNKPIIATQVHTLLGVLGFVLSCTIIWYLIRFLKAKIIDNNKPQLGIFSGVQHSVPTVENDSVFKQNHSIGMLSVISIVLACILCYQPFPKQHIQNSIKTLQLPATFAGYEIPLSKQEKEFFKRNAAEAIKYQLHWNGHKGSLVFIRSRYWKAQHDPRNCYSAQGITVDDEKTLVFSNSNKHKLTIKYLSLNQGKQTGFYWFQSRDQQTADFSARLFSGWHKPNEPWIMVSVAWHDPLSIQSIEQVTQQLYWHINTQLKNDW